MSDDKDKKPGNRRKSARSPDIAKKLLDEMMARGEKTLRDRPEIVPDADDASDEDKGRNKS